MAGSLELQSPQEQQFHALIVGGGICGLATAVAILLAGSKCTVFETVDEVREVGAGLQITPNGTRLLEKWGLFSELRNQATEPETFSMYRYDGRILAHRENYDQEIKTRYGSPIWCLHRADLQRALLCRAKQLGAQVRFGAHIQSVDQDNLAVTLNTGETVLGDIIVAADGLRSSTRTFIIEKSLAPEPTGDLAYRILLDAANIQEPELKKWLRTTGIHIWVGPGVHAVAYSIKGGRWLNLVLCVPDDLPQSVARAKGNLEEMRRLFVGWDSMLTRFLEYARIADKWKLTYMKPLPTWLGRLGHCVVVGDASHAILPYMAQGANSSLEDAAVLGDLLGRASSSGVALPTALSLFDKLRRARMERLVAETFAQATEHHLPDGPEQIARDKMLAKSFECNREQPWTHPKIQGWIYTYDAYHVAAEALEEHAQILS